jgi:hypothetical protein
VDPFHERLARIGLEAAHQYGFALAGGYAVQAVGMLQRPTEDIDLFTAWERRADFTAAVTAIIEAYTDAGYTVDSDRRHDTFVRLTVSEGTSVSKVELAVNTRRNAPILMTIGPVLHPDDAVANKMNALYSRALPRDFIDIDAVLRSGRYDPAALLRLAERADVGFDRGVFADALGQLEYMDEEDFTEYGVGPEQFAAISKRFGAWRHDLLAELKGPSAR